MIATAASAMASGGSPGAAPTKSSMPCLAVPGVRTKLVGDRAFTVTPLSNSSAAMPEVMRSCMALAAA